MEITVCNEFEIDIQCIYHDADPEVGIERGYIEIDSATISILNDEKSVKKDNKYVSRVYDVIDLPRSWIDANYEMIEEEYLAATEPDPDRYRDQYVRRDFWKN